jgi:hypothetical protein
LDYPGKQECLRAVFLLSAQACVASEI